MRSLPGPVSRTGDSRRMSLPQSPDPPLAVHVVRLVDPVADVERAVGRRRDADRPEIVAAATTGFMIDWNDAPCGSRRYCSMRWSPHEVTSSVPR